MEEPWRDRQNKERQGEYDREREHPDERHLPIALRG
jgi:hypothetical protein